MEPKTQKLLQSYQKFQEENPGKRIRDAALNLGVSEAELVACQLGENIVRLENKPEEILSEIEPFGEVMALTRNQSCVHERKGVYEGPQFHTMGPMRTGLFVNPDIDLRLFMSHWSFIFAVTEDTKVGTRRSIQFFDKSGTALHKIYLTNHSNEDHFDVLLNKYRAVDQNPILELEEYPEKAPDPADEEVDWDKFLKAWEGMKDTHDFFPMLRKFKVGREQAFKHVPDHFAIQVSNDVARSAIELAQEMKLEIMVFVGNRGCIQIHTGTVNKLVDHGSWFNILDPKFNLHLNEAEIARTWITRKPTEDGIVTAVEVFDKDGEIITTLFGKRKPGEPELDGWRAITSQLTDEAAQNAA
ncbi:hemin-degrading factor [Sneathiella sp. P13V-1]|uniref:hemin-degrading factor n=1 Tax=Sneathiella sp. P13V-1 TaxID=2697366 RepID=UPI00187BC17A|nr:ChuX/HutX family heme-like substrate-binding protein [Sneathiella sp. P13V-1]MBE7636605.1 hemin-degrading factor [Sneathiella sp. P13V-1]